MHAVLERFGQDAFRVIHWALSEAVSLNHGVVGCGHLLLGLLRLDHPAGAPELSAAREVLARSVDLATAARRPALDTAVKRVLDGARRVALAEGHSEVAPPDLLEALMTETEGVHVEMLHALRDHRE